MARKRSLSAEDAEARKKHRAEQERLRYAAKCGADRECMLAQRREARQRWVAAMKDDERHRHYAQKRQAERRRVAAMKDDERRQHYAQKRQAEQRRVAAMGDKQRGEHCDQKRQAEQCVVAMEGDEREASPGESGQQDRGEQRQSRGQSVGAKGRSQRRTRRLQQRQELPTVCTNPKLPLPRLKPGGPPENHLAMAAARVTSELPNFKTLVCLANSMSPQWKPLCAIDDGNLHRSTLPSAPPIIFATPCNSKTGSSQSELLSSSTGASSRLPNLPSGTAVVFSAPCPTGTGTTQQTKLLCPSSGTRSHDIQLSSAPTTVLATPLASGTPEPLLLCFSHGSSSSNSQHPMSEPKVVVTIPHSAETQLSQSRLLCSSSNSLLPNMPTLLFTAPCKAEAPHDGTPKNCVTLTTVPGMQVCTAERPSFARSQPSPMPPPTLDVAKTLPFGKVISSAELAHLKATTSPAQFSDICKCLVPINFTGHGSGAVTTLPLPCTTQEATQCKSSVDQVCTSGSQTETGHMMVEAGTQTAMVIPRTIPVQTRPKKLRTLGTNTVPER